MPRTPLAHRQPLPGAGNTHCPADRDLELGTDGIRVAFCHSPALKAASTYWPRLFEQKMKKRNLIKLRRINLVPKARLELAQAFAH
jgi:hypothetical protein